MPTDRGVAPDGSPVAVYLATPLEPEFTPLLDDLPAQASVLDLGCGVGRLANELARRGHEVVGVDESADMLAHLDPAVTGVHRQIETLDLGRTFDAVVLASHLLNVPEPTQRQALLATVRRHLASGGVGYLEHWSTEVIGRLADGAGHAGPVAVSFRVLAARGREFDAEVTYALDGQRWAQTFTARLLDEDELDDVLAQAGLRRLARLHPKWLAVMPQYPR